MYVSSTVSSQYTATLHDRSSQEYVYEDVLTYSISLIGGFAGLDDWGLGEIKKNRGVRVKNLNAIFDQIQDPLTIRRFIIQVSEPFRWPDQTLIRTRTMKSAARTDNCIISNTLQIVL